MSEKRAHQRISVYIELRYFFGKMFYSGTASDISKKGMFITTAECIPPGSETVLIIPCKGDLLIANSRVIRLRQKNSCFDGMGIEISHPKNNYIEFVNSLGTFT